MISIKSIKLTLLLFWALLLLTSAPAFASTSLWNTMLWDTDVWVTATDTDGDGIDNSTDNCVSTVNIDQADSDSDGLGDACDTCISDPLNDADGDGVCGDIDNCPADANADQADTDSDGLGDTCDADMDNDGVSDAEDNNPLDPAICRDSDNDGCDDCSVGVDGLGPLADFNPANDGTDTDLDGLCDAGGVDTDLDNDGVSDAEDNNPLDPAICRDSDNDACDDCSVGVDGLGPLADFNPANDGTDTDLDGLCDAGGADTDLDGDGVPNGTDPLPLDAAVGRNLELWSSTPKTFESGEQVLLQWQAVTDAVKYKVSFSLNNGKLWSKLSTPTTTDLIWTAPLVDKIKSNCLFKVTAKDANGTTLSTVVTPVTLTINPPQPVALLTPNGGESYTYGDTVDITWFAPLAAAKTQIKYTIDNGLTWTLIGKPAANLETYSWEIPAVVKDADSCLVKITVKTADNIKLSADSSDLPFSIDNPVDLLSPVGGEQWMSGTEQSVSWSIGATPALVSKIQIKYTINGGKVWNALRTLSKENTALTSTSWIIPLVNKDKGKTKVKLTFKDSFNNTLAVEESPLLTLLQPPYDAGLLIGNYRFSQIGFDTTSYVAYGKASFDGTESGTYAALDHTFGNTESGPLSYTVTSDGQVLINGDGQGFLSETGDLLLVTDTDPSGSFNLDSMIMLRQSSGLNSSILNGSYHAVRYGYQDTSPGCVNLDLDFDGDALATYTETADSTGGQLETLPLTYAVNSSGVLTLEGLKAGQVSWDGSIISFTETGVGNLNNERSIILGVAASTGHSDSDLVGEYVFGEIGGDFRSTWTSILLLTFNGDGTGDYANVRESTGYPETGSITYSITDAGLVTIDGAVSGYLSPDNSTVILSDADSKDLMVSLMVGIKRAADAPELPTLPPVAPPD